jgi:hypothetical protein
VFGVGEDGVDDLVRVALLAEDGRAVLRVLVERRVHLVVEVVEQCGDPPEHFVLAVLPCVCGRRGFDGEGVPEQGLALRVLRERPPSLFPSRFQRAGIARYGCGTSARRRASSSKGSSS